MICAVSAQAEAPQLVVVTVTWNSLAHLEGFAQSLGAGAGGLRWHLVVADNDSADGTADVAESMAWPAGGTVEVLRTGGNLGYAAAINAALRTVPADLPVLVTNPDVRYDDGAVAALHAAWVAGEGELLVPVQLDGEGRPLPTLRREPSVGRAWGEAVLGGTRAGRHARWGEMVTDPAPYRVAGEADWATGSSLLVGPRCRAAVGDWDERYFLYSEETDFALRARDLGMPTRLVPGARCRHLLGESHENASLWALLTVNRVRLFRRRHRALPTAAFRAGLVAGTAVRAAATRRATHRAALTALLTPSRRWPEQVRRLRGS